MCPYLRIQLGGGKRGRAMPLMVAVNSGQVAPERFGRRKMSDGSILAGVEVQLWPN